MLLPIQSQACMLLAFKRADGRCLHSALPCPALPCSWRCVQALGVMEVLVSLARRTPLRTVVCTIHQPSSDITDLFDDFMLLAQGERGTVWEGGGQTKRGEGVYTRLPARAWHTGRGYLFLLFPVWAPCMARHSRQILPLKSHQWTASTDMAPTPPWTVHTAHEAFMTRMVPSVARVARVAHLGLA